MSRLGLLPHASVRGTTSACTQPAMKFADADVFGFRCGTHSRITISDIVWRAGGVSPSRRYRPANITSPDVAAPPRRGQSVLYVRARMAALLRSDNQVCGMLS